MSRGGDAKQDEDETIQKALGIATAVKDSNEYVADDKKIIITTLYKLLSRRIPNIDEKVAKLMPSQNKFGKRDDDDRHHGMWTQVKSFMDPELITSNDIDEILANVQDVVRSEAFLKCSSDRLMALLTLDIEDDDFPKARAAEMYRGKVEPIKQ